MSIFTQVLFVLMIFIFTKAAFWKVTFTLLKYDIVDTVYNTAFK